jgi:hypothetical protein
MLFEMLRVTIHGEMGQGDIRSCRGSAYEDIGG